MAEDNAALIAVGDQGGTRKCPSCNLRKPIADFYKCASRRSGVAVYCRQCTALRWAATYNKQQGAERRMKAYYADHQGSLEKQRKYRSENASAYRGYAAKRNSDPKIAEARRKYCREWYAKNRRRAIDNVLQWQKNNPDRFRLLLKSARRTRRAHLRGAGGSVSVREWDDIQAAFNHCCAYCLRSSWEVGSLEQEHMLPVSRGGQHIRENVIPSCRRCNASKLNKTLLEFLVYKSGDFSKPIPP